MAKELNKFMLSAIAIIGLTVIVLVGIAISTAFSKELRTTTTITNINTTVTTSLSAANSTTTLTGFPFVQSLSGCMNATAESSQLLPNANFTLSEGVASGGTITLLQPSASWEGTALNCSDIEYLADSSGQASADKFSTGLGIFGTFSVIIILALVGKAIISLFRKKD